MAVKYYDELSNGLGLEFINTPDIYFKKNCQCTNCFRYSL